MIIKSLKNRRNWLFNKQEMLIRRLYGYLEMKLQDNILESIQKSLMNKPNKSSAQW
jgi:hypothetical protein